MKEWNKFLIATLVFGIGKFVLYMYFKELKILIKLFDAGLILFGMGLLIIIGIKVFVMPKELRHKLMEE